jgi:hypothetical protein
MIFLVLLACYSLRHIGILKKIYDAFSKALFIDMFLSFSFFLFICWWFGGIRGLQVVLCDYYH